jgi:hypothetical protein
LLLVERLDCVTSFMHRVIYVHIDTASCLHLSDSIFSCASLEELQLHIYPFSYISAQSINLPCLKVLDLSNALINRIELSRVSLLLNG